MFGATYKASDNKTNETVLIKRGCKYLMKRKLSSLPGLCYLVHLFSILFVFVRILCFTKQETDIFHQTQTGHTFVNEDFIEEMRILQYLNNVTDFNDNRFVPKVYHQWDDDHFFYIAMEFCDGMSLSNFMRLFTFFCM